MRSRRRKKKIVKKSRKRKKKSRRRRKFRASKSGGGESTETGKNFTCLPTVLINKIIISSIQTKIIQNLKDFEECNISFSRTYCFKLKPF